MTANLPPRAPDAAGNFRVAAMPQWNEGENYSAENGGSTWQSLRLLRKRRQHSNSLSISHMEMEYSRV
ncbi:MAG: hypothetical protein V8S54_02200 [Lachnospiraceae bacterium]